MGDPDGVEDAAGLHELDVEKVTSVGPDELHGVGRPEDGFIGHDRDRALFADGPEAGRVPGHHRLFDQLDPEFIHAAEGVDRLRHAPALVGVDPQVDVGPDGLPNGLDPGDILVGIETDLGLERFIAPARVLPGVRGHGRGRVDARRHVGLEGRLVPAEQAENGKARDLSQDVEQGRVIGRDDAGIGVDRDSHLGHEAFDGQGVPADEHLPEAPGHGQVRVLGFAGNGRKRAGFPDSDQAGIGVDPDQDIICGADGAEGDPKGRFQRNVELEDIDRRDLHFPGNGLSAFQFFGGQRVFAEKAGGRDA